MDPERALQELLALENSSASSDSEQISLPNAGALERELHSSDDEGPEIQTQFEQSAVQGTSFSETGPQDYHDASSSNEMDTSVTQVRSVWLQWAALRAGAFRS